MFRERKGDVFAAACCVQRLEKKSVLGKKCES